MITVELPGGARARFTGRAEGDLGHAGVYITEVTREVAARRRAVLDLPWTWLRQVHGDAVVVVEGPGHQAGTRADGSVTVSQCCALAVLTADCAPVALASPEGVIGAVHAGWTGLVAGILERTLDAMGALGATNVAAVLGPCIGPECYEFGADDLEDLVGRFGDVVRGRTSGGAPALDLRRAVTAALAAAGVADVEQVGVCTSCSPDHWSHRRAADEERQALVAWI